MADFVGSSTGDNLVGTTLADTFDVGEGGEPLDFSDNDTVTADSGDDVIIHLQRGDSADGGGGTDKAQVWLASQWVEWVAGSVRQEYNHLGLNVDLTNAAGAGTLFLASGGLGGGGVTLTSIEVYDVTFGSGNDIAWGGSGDDRLVGEAYNYDLYTPENLGHDELHGRGGNDTIDGMVGSDHLYGDEGNDNIDGGVLANTGGFDDLIGDYMYGGTGDDTVTVRPLDYADGGDNSDTVALFGLSAGKIDLAITTAQDIGSGAADTTIVNFENILGSYYTDMFWGDAGANVIDGYRGGDDEIHGRAGNDTIYGGWFGANQLYGDEDNDVLYGHGGGDYLDGGTGNDTMYGQGGNDVYIVDSAQDVVSEADIVFGWDMGGTDEVRTGLTYTLGQYLENLTLTGAGAVNGTGNSLNNFLTGNSAINRLSGYDGNDRLDGGMDADNMSGGAGNDTYVVDNTGDVVSETSGGVDTGGVDTVESSLSYSLRTYFENLTLTGVQNIDGSGNSLSNAIVGNDGNNSINGGSGIDTMTGGLGNDTYVVDNAADVVVEVLNQGVDTVQTSLSYILGANVENLTLTGTLNRNANGNSLDNVMTGNSGVNILRGLEGNDFIDGGAAADRMYGAIGNDTFVVDNAGDVVIENAGEGIDTIQTTLGYALGSGVENLTLTGTLSRNGNGNSLDNALTGNAGSNVLKGLVGNDTIDGAGGSDNLWGGANADTFVFNLASGTDIIRDFSATDNDLINVHAYTAGVTNTGLLSTVGGNTLIDLGGGNTITVMSIVSTDAGLLSHIVW